MLQLTAAYEQITSRVTSAVSQRLSDVTGAVNDLSDYTEVSARLVAMRPIQPHAMPCNELQVTRACNFLVDTVADAHTQDLCVRAAVETAEDVCQELLSQKLGTPAAVVGQGVTVAALLAHQSPASVTGRYAVQPLHTGTGTSRTAPGSSRPG